MGYKLSIHPQAVVDDDCEIGQNTKVWQFASVIRGSKIGNGCVVGSSSTIDGAKIGNHCKIAAGAFICPGSFIGDRCFIGPNVSFCNDLWPEVSTIGFDFEKLGDHWTVILEHRVSIGAGAVLLPGVRIKSGSFVAAGAVVNQDVPSNFLWRSDNQLIPLNGPRKRMRYAK